MAGRNNPQVLVVGAGPVGLFAALGLARRDVGVQVVDKDWRTGAHSYALALHPASLGLLDQVGRGDAVRRQAYRVDRVGLYEGPDRKAELRLSDEGDTRSFLAVLRQDVLEHLLEDALRARGVKVRWNHEVARLAPGQETVAATIDRLEKDSVGYAAAHTEWVVARSDEVEVPLVVGADGHGSMVRRSLGIDFAEVAPRQHFAVFEFQSDFDPQHEMRIVMDQGTTSVLWPLPGGCVRWSFQLADFTAPESTRLKDRIAVEIGRQPFPVLGEESLRAMLARRAPWFGGRIGEIHWRIAVRFEHRLAASFGSGRTWLAGDAGHMTGPVGMQSMNVGLREADELAAVTAGILREGQPLKRLEEYGRGRTAEWRRLLGQEGGLKPAGQTDPWIAQRADRLLRCLPASGGALAELAGQLGLGLA